MKRILTAIVALPVLLYTVWSPIPYFFVVLAAAAVVLALAEFYALSAKIGARPQVFLGYAAALAIGASFVLDSPGAALGALVTLAILSLSAGVLRPDRISDSLLSASATGFGVVYVGLLGGCLIGIRMMPESAPQTTTVHLGSKLLTMFFATVMMTDTAAYYVGRAAGRHKLAPRISPGKTVEGAIGGLFGAMIAAVVCRWTFFPGLPLSHALLLGSAIGVIAQIGDLAESMLKRCAGVKDSGRLLPGHGGMLDRIDSILFCAPLLYYYSRFFADRL